MREFKMCNVLLRPDSHMVDHVDLYYRCDGKTEYDNADGSLHFSGRLDLATYFNALSVAKWKRYAGIEDVWLHAEIAGSACDCFLTSYMPEDRSESVRLERLDPAGGDYATFDVKMPAVTPDVVLQGIELVAEESCSLRNAYFYTRVEEDNVRPARIALCTTTFKKEEYIEHNIQLIRDEIVHSDDAVAEGFHMFVVDNGRTLDESLGGDGVSIIPNQNVGGAGGFARGMMEALASEGDFTHVLLMDDDVRVSSESIKRTWSLVSLACGEYADAFVNGAMLTMEEPHVQHEDVGVVISTGNFDRTKPTLFLDNMRDVVNNETINVEVPHAYGAWWYSCIPTKAIRENGLPLPVFVRCDDIEYGIRCQARYMTMGGICVWHEGFGERIMASSDCYQNVRNFLIMTSLHDLDDIERMFMVRTESNFRMHLRTMYYGAAELIVKALEDYMKGPEFLASSSGEQLFKGAGAFNEKLLPLEELDQSAIANLSVNKDALGLEHQTGRWGKMLRLLPYDRHFLPGFMLRDDPASVYYCGSMRPDPSLFARRRLVAMNRDATRGCLRTMDKKRWRSLRARWCAAKRDYHARRSDVKRAYQEAFPELTSREFWERYLGVRR